MLEKIIENTSEYIDSMPKMERKKYGQFFTSIETARYMAELFEILEDQDKISILDAGAGSGILSCAMIERLEDIDTVKNIEVLCYETDINVIPLLQKNLNIAKEFSSKEVDFVIKEDNYILSQYLDFNHMIGGNFNPPKYDVVIGNPPYMKTEDIKAFTPKEKSLYEKGNRYTSAYKQYDKYFLFIERALNLLKPDGYLGYVVPNKFMKVGAAKELRNFIANNAYLKTMISFGAHQVFADKSTYTCIIVLEKNKHENFKYSEVSDFIGWRVRNVNAYKFCDRPSVTINADTWILCTDEHLPLLNAVTAHTKPLGDIVGDDYIFNGIQTSANKIYVFVPISETRTTYTFKAFDGNEYEVEKAVTKPYFKTAQGADAMSTYRTFKPNARVFFPYKKDNDGHLQLIPLTTIQRRYPLFYTFLMAAKPELDKASRDIQPKPTTADEWYRYGRHQSLEACEVEEKMIVGVLAQTDKYAIDNNGTLVSSGGTAGYCLVSIPSDSQYSIYYIQAILGSIQGEWLASLYGEIFRGGYIARGTKVLKQIPIREIDFTDQNERNVHDDIADRQKRLIELGDKISKAAKNRRSLIPLQRQFDLLKHEQQNVINMLYGMTNDEVSLIPKIKELYAAD